MSRLTWDGVGERFYETGTDHGILFPYNSASHSYGKGEAWNGLTAVTESPSGAELSAIYADNIKYLNLMSAEDFAITIEAYTYPDTFAACDGSKDLIGGATPSGVMVGQQKRQMFGFAYRTRVGNDEQGDDLGYKWHLVYGCMASPSERAYATVNESPEAMTFSWEVSTTPQEIGEGFRQSAHIEIDSRTSDPDLLKDFEDYLLGTDGSTGSGTTGTDPQFPSPTKVIELFTPTP